MRVTSFLWDDPGLAGAWAKLAQALLFNPLRRDDAARRESPRWTNARAGGLFERLDRWFWRQAQREQEAYLAGSSDIYDLERRIRRLERLRGSRFS